MDGADRDSVVRLGDVFDVLIGQGVLRSLEIKPHIKPGHGPCCTCQTCGYHYDDCVCDDNEIIEALNKIPEVR